MTEELHAFINELVEIKKKMELAMVPDVFQDDVVFALNAKNLPKKVKFRLGKLLEQSMRIKCGTLFTVSTKVASDGWKKARDTLDAYIKFEILMADFQLQKISEKEFVKKAIELVEIHVPLIYMTSFQEKMIFGVLVERGCSGDFGELAEEKQLNLNAKVKIKGVDQTLLEYFLRLKPRKEIAEILKIMAENQKIAIQDFTSDGKTTYRTLFKEFLDNNEIPFSAKIHRKSEFMYFQDGNPKGIKQLPFDSVADELLTAKISDTKGYQNEYIKGELYEIILYCSNEVLRAKLTLKNSDMPLNVQLAWLKRPPKGKQVVFYVADAANQREERLPPECCESIRQELASANAYFTVKIPPNELNIDPISFKTTILKQDLRKSDVLETELGYLFWRPLYKEKYTAIEADIDEADTQITDEDPLVQAEPESERVAGQRTYALLGLLECFIDPRIKYKKSNNDLYVDDANNQLYFDGFDKTVKEEVSKILTEKGGDTLDITKEAPMIKSLVAALDAYNAIPNYTGKFSHTLQSPTVLRISNLSRRYDINAFIEYTCAVSAKGSTDKTVVVETNEQVDAVREIFKDDKNVKITRNEKDNTTTIVGSPEVVKEIAKVISDEFIEEVFNETPLLYNVATNGSGFQRSKDMLIQKIDSIHYRIILRISTVTDQRTAPIIEVEIQDNERFKAKGRPKEMLAFTKSIMDYRQSEIERLRAEAGLFREEKTLVRDEIQRLRKELNDMPDVKIIERLDNRIVIEGPKIQKQEVMDRLEKLQERIRIEKIEIIKNSTEECTIKKMPDKILMAVLNRVQLEVKRYGGKGQIQSTVVLKNMNEETVVLKLEQGNKTTIGVFVDVVEAMRLCFDRYVKVFAHLERLKTILVGKEVKRLTIQGKLRKAQERKTMENLRQEYTEILSKQFDIILKRFQMILSNQLRDYIEKSDLRKQFETNIPQEMSNAFSNFVGGIPFFKIVRNNKLQDLKKNQPKRGQASKIEKCIKETIKPLFDTLQSQFEKNALTIESIMSAFQALKILTKTYYDLNLPIVEHLTDFNRIFKDNQLIVVKTGTGSGKSTVLPPYLVGLGMRKVMVTQPRRLPCSEIYKRVDSIYGGDMVGYMFAGESKNPAGKLIYITDGLLKEKIYANEDDLAKIDVIMLDEIHERSKSVDLILLLLIRALNKHKHLKVILCSATVNDQIMNMFDNTIKRATFEVAIPGFQVTEHPIDEGKPILDEVNELSGKLMMGTQMLVFFSSIKEVEDSTKLFKQKYNKNAFSLFGNQSGKVQEESIQNGQIFFSTSIAETSLTFPKLQYVVDSRLSRIMCYDIDLETMVSEEIPSSQSSIKQRRGRLGRNCPGDYYYYTYSNQTPPPPYELTELERVDLTGVLFELLMKYDTVDEVYKELNKLNPSNKNLFKAKFQYAVNVLDNFNLLVSKKQISKNCHSQFMVYGNCGNPRFNVALHQGVADGCFENVAALVAFSMMGSNILPIILKDIPQAKKSPDGDIETVGRFILDIAEAIQLRTLPFEDIKKVIFAIPGFRGKRWLPTLCRIMRQLKKFFSVTPNGVASYDWTLATKCFTYAFSNCIYFNKSLIGGNRNYYQKVVSDRKYGESTPERPIQYLLNKDSICWKRDNQSEIPYVIALFSSVNPFRECTLSFCSRITPDLIEIPINIVMKRHESIFKHTDNMMDDLPIFNRHYDEMNANNEMKIVKKNFPQFEMWGPANRVFKRVTSLYNDITNQSVVIDAQKMFDEIVETRLQARKTNPSLRQINETVVRQNFDQMNFFEVFKTLRYEMQTYYGTKMKERNKKITLEKARGGTVEVVYKRLTSFFKWFIDCQKIYLQENKEKFVQQPDEKILGPSVFTGICSRLEEIVNSQREYHLVRSMVYGKSNRSPRICRMIAVCWILVKRFDCVVKGGFVRDWIINGKDEIDNNLDLRNLLQINPRNGFYEIPDEARVTPSDIDVDLSNETLFNRQIFLQEMNKLNIRAEIVDDGWRFHVVFDKGGPTGGFTADLIQPYCWISHDSFDFDVNVFFVKKNHLKQIGMKVPLELEPLIMGGGGLARPDTIKVTLEDLIIECRKMNMRRTRAEIYAHRIKKFEARGWKISPVVYEPVIYRSLVTVAEKATEEYLNSVDPNWKKNMANFKIVKVEHLKNASWDDAYMAAVNWIRQETKGSNVNDKLLYHGTDEAGATGIKYNGFDSRYFSKSGMYGRGAYFADIPTKSHDYAPPNAVGCRFMFVVKVALGKQEHLTAANNAKLGPDPGYHSLLGTAGKVSEYIIERWGQAKPMLLITYK